MVLVVAFSFGGIGDTNSLVSVVSATCGGTGLADTLISVAETVRSCLVEKLAAVSRIVMLRLSCPVTDSLGWTKMRFPFGSL